MKESLSEDLIHLGVDFVVTILFLGIFGLVVICIIKSHNRNVHHDQDNNNNNDHVTIPVMECVGLKPYVLRSIPIVDFNSKDFKDSVECVVCISDLVDGDKSRVLPSCNHWFHTDCIDSWFLSHNTCPICRKIVCLAQQGTRAVPVGDEGLIEIHVPITEHHGIPTDSSSMSTEAAVVEDADDGGENEGPPPSDITEVVIDIPAKPSFRPSFRPIICEDTAHV